MSGERTGQQHFIKLFSYTTRYFWLLIIPLIRSLYSLSLDVDAFRVWIRGTWLDLIVLAAIIAFAWIRLMSVTYKFNSERIIVKKGLVAVTEDTVFYSEISTLSIKQNLFYKMVGAAKVYIATNAGIFDKADITLVMKRSDADRLYASMKNTRVKSLNYSISPNKLRLFIFSIIASSTLSGVAVAVAFIVETWQVFDREVETRLILDTLSEFANRAAKIVPPIAAGISIVIIASWLISFVTNIFYFWDYILTKCPDAIYIKSGLFAKNRHIISLNRVNYIDLKQNFVAKVFNISSLHCHCSGYGSTGRSELSVIMPITTAKEINGTISEVFPDYPHPKIQLRPSPRGYGGFYFWPIVWALIPLAIFGAVEIFLPSWHSVAVTAVVIAEIPAIWLAVVKTLSLFITGIGMTDGHIIMSYAKLYSFHTVIAPKDRITKVVIRQSIPQHMSGTCTAVIYTASDSKVKQYVYGLKLDKALNFFDKNGFDLYFSENPE